MDLTPEEIKSALVAANGDVTAAAKMIAEIHAGPKMPPSLKQLAALSLKSQWGVQTVPLLRTVRRVAGGVSLEAYIYALPLLDFVEWLDTAPPGTIDEHIRTYMRVNGYDKFSAVFGMDWSETYLHGELRDVIEGLITHRYFGFVREDARDMAYGRYGRARQSNFRFNNDDLSLSAQQRLDEWEIPIARHFSVPSTPDKLPTSVFPTNLLGTMFMMVVQFQGAYDADRAEEGDLYVVTQILTREWYHKSMMEIVQELARGPGDTLDHFGVVWFVPWGPKSADVSRQNFLATLKNGTPTGWSDDAMDMYLLLQEPQVRVVTPSAPGVEDAWQSEVKTRMVKRQVDQGLALYRSRLQGQAEEEEYRAQLTRWYADKADEEWADQSSEMHQYLRGLQTGRWPDGWKYMLHRVLAETVDQHQYDPRELLLSSEMMA